MVDAPPGMPAVTVICRHHGHADLLPGRHQHHSGRSEAPAVPAALPSGLSRTDVDRPDEATIPLTGRLNRFR